MTILQAWNERRRLRAEGSKLWAEGRKLWAEGRKLRADGNVEIKWEGDDAIVEGVRYGKVK